MLRLWVHPSDLFLFLGFFSDPYSSFENLIIILVCVGFFLVHVWIDLHLSSTTTNNIHNYNMTIVYTQHNVHGVRIWKDTDSHKTVTQAGRNTGQSEDWKWIQSLQFDIECMHACMDSQVYILNFDAIWYHQINYVSVIDHVTRLDYMGFKFTTIASWK